MAEAEASVRDRRRAEIVAAARHLVSEGGVEALTIGRLERRVSFTRGVITYHFDNKEEIVAAVLDSAVAEIDAATFADVAASQSLREQVRAVLSTKVHGFLDHPDASRILLSFWARSAHDASAREVNQRLFRVYRKQSRNLVETSGADVDIDAFAALLVGTVIGIVTQVQIDPDRVDPDATIEEATAALTLRLERS
ncbi:MAG: TetR/AcrR family transcriptional regulator [Deltaproteobacteria bacterium]|nr:MAG: TetR/AcrR family transcriptional regulator [Deltaproteobacteria bacterium]